MNRKQARIALVGALVLVLTMALSGGIAQAKKKKKAGGNVVTVTNTVTGAVPDRPAGVGTVAGRLDRTLNVGKKFKGKKVGSVEVTFQTTGDSAGSASDLDFYVTAPNGRQMGLYWETSFGGQSIGPLTLTPDSPVRMCNTATPPCSNPFATLNRPFAGTAGEPFLAMFDGVRMNGNWTFTVLDFDNTETSTLNFVRLKITAQS